MRKSLKPDDRKWPGFICCGTGKGRTPSLTIPEAPQKRSGEAESLSLSASPFPGIGVPAVLLTAGGIQVIGGGIVV